MCDGNGYCKESCNTASDCPSMECYESTCDQGVCGLSYATLGTACGTPGNNTVCDGNGSCKESCGTASQCLGSDSDCMARTCTLGVCGVSYATPGTSCGPQGSGFCDGTGNCCQPDQDHVLEVGLEQKYKYHTIGDAAQDLKAGVLMKVHGPHVYREYVDFDIDGGTGCNMIVIRGVTSGGKRPTISGTGRRFTVTLEGSNYAFRNFNVTTSTTSKERACVYLRADNLFLEDVNISGCPRNGIQGADGEVSADKGNWGAGSVTLTSVEVDGCGKGLDYHQIYMSTDEDNYPNSVFLMQYCYLHGGKGGNAVKSRGERNSIYYNWIEHAANHELDLIGADPGAHKEGKAVENSDVVGNVLIHAKSKVSTANIGSDGTGQSWGQYRFVSNTFLFEATALAAPAIEARGGIDSVSMYNNAFRKKTGGVIEVLAETQPNEEVPAAWLWPQKWAGNHNSVDLGSTVLGMLVQQPGGFASVVTGTPGTPTPGFVNESNNEVELENGSPLCNQATSSTPLPPGRPPFALSPLPPPEMLPRFMPPRHAIGYTLLLQRPRGTANDVGAYECP